MFSICAAIYVLGAIVFGLLSSSTTQKWALNGESDENEQVKEETTLRNTQLNAQENYGYTKSESPKV